MTKTVFVVLATALVPFRAFAVDGTVLINQSTVTAAGGFPYKIMQSGSYRLSGNLIVPDANTTAIQVMADTVTVVNGTVRGMGKFGIALGLFGTVEKVQIDSNGSIGILMTRGKVSGNTVTRNLGVGIQCDGCTVSGNTVIGNGDGGIACCRCPSTSFAASCG